MMDAFMLPSAVEPIPVDGKDFFIKRDDLIHPDFSGNKARKFWYWLRRDFPEVRRVVSMGSNQSNAMYSLSVLARMRGWRFDYFVDHIPEFLKKNPSGNYGKAVENGTRFIEMSFGGEALGRAARDFASGEDALFIEEGGRQPEAEEGISVLAEEIIRWQEKAGVAELTVFLPSGTGTTALYLQKYFVCYGRNAASSATKVITTPCVGDVGYLRRQFSMLEPDRRFWPRIIDLPRKYHFGKLYREFYEIWLKLGRESGVEFDLLYDPKGWLTLLAKGLGEKGTVLYIHQGGTAGNESMLTRYRRKFPMMECPDPQRENGANPGTL